MATEAPFLLLAPSHPTVDVRDSSLIELLAHVLRPGGGAPASSLAAAVLARVGGANRLAAATPSELASVPGLGAREAARVASAIELGRRVGLGDEEARPRFVDSAAVATFARPRLAGVLHEELWIVAVDAQQRLRVAGCIARGGLHGLHVAVRDPLRFAVRHGGSAMIAFHNHPSGDPSPSLEDLAFTEKLAAAGEMVGVPLLDHVIVVERRHFSMLDAGLLGHPAGGHARDTAR